jgi:hypothetical protein
LDLMSLMRPNTSSTSIWDKLPFCYSRVVDLSLYNVFYSSIFFFFFYFYFFFFFYFFFYFYFYFFFSFSISFYLFLFIYLCLFVCLLVFIKNMNESLFLLLLALLHFNQLTQETLNGCQLLISNLNSLDPLICLLVLHLLPSLQSLLSPLLLPLFRQIYIPINITIIYLRCTTHIPQILFFLFTLLLFMLTITHTLCLLSFLTWLSMSYCFILISIRLHLFC